MGFFPMQREKIKLKLKPIQIIKFSVHANFPECKPKNAADQMAPPKNTIAR